jgi:protein phosphatase
MLDLEFAGLSDTGKLRERNEDFIGYAAPASAEQANERGWLFALADGVGGQDHGDVASRLAIETLQAGFHDYRRNESPGACLQRLIQTANLKIHQGQSAPRSNESAMCTTVVACLFRFDRVVVAHVGDSRCYLIRRGQAELLTRDHTVVGEQLSMGLLSHEEATESERRHVLSRSLGATPIANVDLNEHQLQPGDLLLLSSDGFHASFTPDEIAIAVSSSQDLEQVAAYLIFAARERDGSDNISVQLIRVKAVERVGMYRGRPYRLR